MPIENIGFKTTVFTGTSQRETVGQGLAKIVQASLEGLGTYSEQKIREKEQARIEANRLKAENEEQDKLFLLDYKIKAQKFQAENDWTNKSGVERKQLQESFIRENPIDFKTDTYKLHRESFDLDELETVEKQIKIDFDTDLKQNVLPSLASSGYKTLTMQEIDAVASGYENFGYKKSQIKEMLLEDISKNINYDIANNAERFVNKTQDEILSNYKISKEIQDPKFRSIVEDTASKIHRNTMETRAYNSYMSNIDKAISTGNPLLIAQMSSTEVEIGGKTYKTKDIIESRLNKAVLSGDAEESIKALKTLSAIGSRSQYVDVLVKGLSKGTIDTGNLPMALNTWKRAKEVGYSFDTETEKELNKYETLYDFIEKTTVTKDANTRDFELHQRTQELMKGASSFKREAMSDKALDELIDDQIGGMFGKYGGVNSDSYSSEVFNRTKELLPYFGYSKDSIEFITKKVVEDLDRTTVEINGNNVVGLGKITSLANFNDKQKIVEMAFEGYKKTKTTPISDIKNDISIDSFPSFNGEDMFNVTYKDHLGDEVSRIMSATDMDRFIQTGLKYKDTLDRAEDKKTKTTKSSTGFSLPKLISEPDRKRLGAFFSKDIIKDLSPEERDNAVSGRVVGGKKEDDIIEKTYKSIKDRLASVVEYDKLEQVGKENMAIAEGYLSVIEKSELYNQMKNDSTIREQVYEALEADGFEALEFITGVKEGSLRDLQGYTKPLVDNSDHLVLGLRAFVSTGLNIFKSPKAVEAKKEILALPNSATMDMATKRTIGSANKDTISKATDDVLEFIKNKKLAEEKYDIAVKEEFRNAVIGKVQDMFKKQISIDDVPMVQDDLLVLSKIKKIEPEMLGQRQLRNPEKSFEELLDIAEYIGSKKGYNVGDMLGGKPLTRQDMYTMMIGERNRLVREYGDKDFDEISEALTLLREVRK